jgi:hypothetical protein
LDYLAERNAREPFGRVLVPMRVGIVPK